MNSKIQILLAAMSAFAVYFLSSIYKGAFSIELCRDLIILGFLIFVTEKSFYSKQYDNRLLFLGMGAGVLFNLGYALMVRPEPLFVIQNVLNSVMGLAVAASSFFVLSLAFQSSFKGKEIMSENDITLAAVIGSFIGPSAVWLIVFWVPILIIFKVTYKIQALLNNQYSESYLPTVAVHFVALATVMFFLNGMGSFLIVLFGLFVLSLASTCLCVEPYERET